MNIMDVARLSREIEALIAEYPELADDEQLRADMLEGETSIDDVLTRIVRREREARVFADAIKKEGDELTARMRRYEQRGAAMRALAKRVLEAASLTKKELPIATLSIRNGQPKVIITDESAVPDAYCRIVKTPDKTRIKEAIAAGEAVPGAVLSNGEPTLTVRCK